MSESVPMQKNTFIKFSGQTNVLQQSFLIFSFHLGVTENRFLSARTG